MKEVDKFQHVEQKSRVSPAFLFSPGRYTAYCSARRPLQEPGGRPRLALQAGEKKKAAPFGTTFSFLASRTEKDIG